MARIRSFAQPSEVHEPLELVRGWVIFHARGVVNTRAIQHNLDWVWPYWVHRQFNPDDPSFIPRAYNISHINLTHRNWTAVGLPEMSIYPIVDPRGLVTPLYDGWSIDAWIFDEKGARLVPSKMEAGVDQELATIGNLGVNTTAVADGMALRSKVQVEAGEKQPELEIDLEGEAQNGGWLVVSLRPYNPEGVQFIDKIEVTDGVTGWLVNGTTQVKFEEKPSKFVASNYRHGDVFHEIGRKIERFEVECDTGMATAAALFPIEPGRKSSARLRVPLGEELVEIGHSKKYKPSISWERALEGTATLDIPDKRMKALYDGAVRTMVLLSADEIFPGPYVYRRFWFRDACIIANAMLAAGLYDHCRRALQRFPERQRRDGYFLSQSGEWDSNGQVLWVFNRFVELTGESLTNEQVKALEKGLKWLQKKRVPKSDDALHSGLLPAGFSAEHLGPNDYYYWDDFWGIAGMRAAANLFRRMGRDEDARRADEQADDFMDCVTRSLRAIPTRQSRGAFPASPNRRMDAGAVGSLVADYPLQLYEAGDERIMKTAEYLLDHSFHGGGFFQEMTHSGINAYLTLEIGQTLLRAGDKERYRALTQAIAELATPTGQWPEAIHPMTRGGCMGDGQHCWAAAEWVLTIRNAFVREEGEKLILGSGVFPDWLSSGEDISFGPTPTPWGPVSVLISSSNGKTRVKVDGDWFDDAPDMVVDLPGHSERALSDPESELVLEEATL